MPRYGRRVHGIEPRHQPQQEEGQKRDQEGQQQAGQNGHNQIPAQAVLRETMAAFEPDREQQVERHELRRALGNGQVASHDRGHKAKHKEQNGWHHEVTEQGVEDSRHQRTPFGSVPIAAEIRIG